MNWNQMTKDQRIEHQLNKAEELYWAGKISETRYQQIVNTASVQVQVYINSFGKNIISDREKVPKI